MRRVLLCAACTAALTASAAADITYFDDHTAFTSFNLLDGKFMKGVEDFEEAVVGPGTKQPLPDPLLPGVPNMGPGGGFPTGLAAANLKIQANTIPLPSPLGLSPSGSPIALFLLGDGFIGANSKKVGEDLGLLGGQVASYDLIFLENDKSGVGFDLSRFAGFNPQVGFNITIYDTAGAIIGNTLLTAPAQPEPNKMFFGVWSSAPIGRINIFDDDISVPGNPVFSPSAVDNVEMWAPEPAGLMMLLIAFPALRRRR